MEKEEIVAEEPVTIAEYTILPIIRKSLHCYKSKEGDIFVGRKHPLAVLVTKGSKIVLYMIEDDVSMEQLIKEVPELKKVAVQ
jgi:hypothetical protein